KPEIEKPERLTFFEPGLVKSGEIKISPKVIVDPKFEFFASDQEAIGRGLQELLKQAKFEEQALELAKAINSIIENVFVDAFSGLGEAIGNVLSGVSLSGAFDGIMKSLAGGLKQIGQLIIRTNVELAILKKVGFSNPAVGIAVGVAITALGTLLQNSIGKTKAFATGVRNFEGGFATVGERGAETVLLPRGSSVIPNNEVMAYGQGGVTLMPSIAYDGTQFRIFLNRVDAKFGRTA
ncbi:MAG TPA: hypothetical protein PLZ45_06710, partial [Ferruginibacter sp.]|nr:hypothetical protein [Ferruginibacter sp.]